MGKIHIIHSKEELEPHHIEGKVAIVYDVLFATSSITAAFHHGALSVYPALTASEAIRMAEGSQEPYLLAGEEQGYTIPGFQSPTPIYLSSSVKNKRLFYKTTNGTVAIRRASQAKYVYVASLLNEQAILDYLVSHHVNDSISLICAGSTKRFAIEDYYGAASMIHRLLQHGEWTLTDRALAAYYFYHGSPSAETVLRTSTVGKWLVDYGLASDVEFVANKNSCPVVPIYRTHTGRIEEVGKDESSRANRERWTIPYESD
ncbi:hypothetical protein N781_04255 [Pontibacillus halophilus JSM 076056 = DSM 19796]|uniref:Probable 2-phosphosulfolactate phosphatase n=1 Tax=Pontibacillus halophilus JSM 076056 = DSM 19796 TaxID=1385510 RepID=A0A0A5GJG7_9BACI|nr:2-phosphosulfolactate phosphatase [Pontibacillus halophilus]KGX91295.1 hypothetical protein N781_04255 [Pontibacillus halophilus JSM 076056 = DSM 19796]